VKGRVLALTDGILSSWQSYYLREVLTNVRISERALSVGMTNRQSFAALFVEQCSLADFVPRGKIEPDSQRRRSLRISRNACSAETVFVAFRLQEENRLSASVTQASSTVARGSSCMLSSNRSANRSRSVAESLRACFSKG